MCDKSETYREARILKITKNNKNPKLLSVHKLVRRTSYLRVKQRVHFHKAVVKTHQNQIHFTVI